MADITTVSVKTTADGERLQRTMDELKKLKLHVGFMPGQNFEKDGTDVAVVAMRNEFGDDKVPARPFMSQAINNNEKAISKIATQALKEEAPKDILDIIGEGLSTLIRKEIEKGDFVPNAPSTIARKGSDKPLIDTGLMKESVEHWIDRG